MNFYYTYLPSPLPMPILAMLSGCTLYNSIQMDDILSVVISFIGTHIQDDVCSSVVKEPMTKSVNEESFTN